MDDQLFGQKDANPGDRMKLLGEMADTMTDQGGCFLIDVHDYVFDERLFPGWRETYQELWNYLVQRHDVWFATPSQIAQHWSERYERIVNVSDGLKQGMP